MGKRQIGELQPYEFAVTLISSNLVTIPMSHLDTPLLWGVVPIYVLLSIGLILSFLSLKSAWARKVICGKPRVLIEKGVIIEASLKKVRYTLNDLLEQLRNNGVFDVSQVYYAYLETNGEISVLLKSQFRALSPDDVSLPVEQEEAFSILIMDGKIQKDNLKILNKDLNWLKRQYKKAHVSSEKEVFIMLFDGNKIFFQGKGDSPRLKEFICAT